LERLEQSSSGEAQRANFFEKIRWTQTAVKEQWYHAGEKIDIVNKAKVLDRNRGFFL
jgi:hypothetical protein